MNLWLYMLLVIVSGLSSYGIYRVFKYAQLAMSSRQDFQHHEPTSIRHSSEYHPSVQQQVSQVDRIVNKGVSHYSSISVVDMYRGLSKEGLRKYLKISVREHEIPKIYEDLYLQFGENLIKDSNRNGHRRNIMFNNKYGSCVWISLMCMRDESDDFNLFVTSLDIDSGEVGKELFAYEDYTGPNILQASIQIDEIQNLHTAILPRLEFGRLFNFFNGVSQNRVSTKLAIDAP